MAFLVSVRLLRHRGARLDSPGLPQDGHLLVDRRKATTCLSLISNIGGIQLLGPLYEARVLNASIDGLVLLGFEREGDASYVQEWLIGEYDGRLWGPRPPPAEVDLASIS